MHNTIKTNHYKKPLRVGFDLDGVLLYNPARIIRRIIVLFKRIFFPKRENKFYIPSSFLGALLYELLHFSSFKKNSGFNELETLLQNKNFEVYIITSRFGFPLLTKNTQWWFKLLNKKGVFVSITQNVHNVQPYFYKENAIKKLGLDVFIEDNLDIVTYLHKATNCKILWMYNVLDSFVDYPNKYKNLYEITHALQVMHKIKKP